MFKGVPQNAYCVKVLGMYISELNSQAHLCLFFKRGAKLDGINALP